MAQKYEEDMEEYEEQTSGKSPVRTVINIVGTIIAVACVGVALWMVLRYTKQNQQNQTEPETTTVAASQHLDKAHQFEAAGEYGRAISAYLLYLESETGTIMIYHDLSKDYLKLNMTQEAQDCDEKILQIFEADPQMSLTNEEHDIVAALYMETVEEYFKTDYLKTYLYLTEECPMTGLYDTYENKELITPVAHPIADNGWQADGTLFYGIYPAEEVTGPEVSSVLVNATYDDRDCTVLYDTTYYREKIQGEYHYFIMDNLQWNVVEDTGSGLLLQTTKIVDCEPFHEELTQIAWDTCSLRDYMGYDFIRRAFTDQETFYLKPNTNYPAGNPTYDLKKDGSTVEDVCFIFGLDQLYARYNKDFHSYMKEHYADYKAQTTGYARAKGAFTDTDGYGKWWIRTMGVDSSRKMTVGQTGAMSTDGFEVNYIGIGIRAAILLSKDAVN